MSSNVRRILLLTAVMLIVILGYRAGVHERVQPDPLREALLGLGKAGPAVYVLAFAVWQTCMLPAAPFLLGAAFTWPLPMAFVVTWVGAICAGIPAFVLSRSVAHDWVQAHLPERAHRFDALLARNGIRAVIVLRLVFFTSAMLHPAIALSKIRFHEFLVGSAIGLLPGVCMWVFFGPRAVEWFLKQPPHVWATIVVGSTVIALLFWTMRRRRTLKRAEEVK